MDNTLRFFILILRLSFGALALALALLTAAALGVPAFAADLAALGMPAPLSWPAALIECALALAAFFLHRPAPRLAAGRTTAGSKGKAARPATP